MVNTVTILAARLFTKFVPTNADETILLRRSISFNVDLFFSGDNFRVSVFVMPVIAVSVHEKKAAKNISNTTAKLTSKNSIKLCFCSRNF